MRIAIELVLVLVLLGGNAVLAASETAIRRRVHLAVVEPGWAVRIRLA